MVWVWLGSKVVGGQQLINYLFNCLSKALRCYKKAHELNPLSDEAGEALGDAYMSLGQEV